MYWPLLNMVTWGIMSTYLSHSSSGVGMAVGMMLGPALLWDIFSRGTLGVFMPFIEELWSRNLGQLFASPIRPLEYTLGIIVLGIFRTIVSLTPCIILAGIFFDYWLTDIGWPLIGFYINLVMSSWWCGFIIISVLLRFGMGAEWMAWILAFSLMPFVSVFYPVSVLPAWVQVISWSLPPTYAFEGMRSILNSHEVRYDLMLESFGLNIIYTLFFAFIFIKSFDSARRRCGILQLANE